jgi:hypothetical protein
VRKTPAKPKQGSARPADDGITQKSVNHPKAERKKA